MYGFNKNAFNCSDLDILKKYNNRIIFIEYIDKRKQGALGSV